ncbi:50S ribosomal protein L18 [Planctomycetota bacterium]
MNATKEKRWKRRRRHLRTRRKVSGTAERPRLAVHRTLKHIYAEVINDELGRTLCAASTRSAELKDLTKTGDVGASRKVGELIGAKAKEAGVTSVVFDRGGCRYHGRVKAVADGARSTGLEF